MNFSQNQAQATVIVFSQQNVYALHCLHDLHTLPEYRIQVH